MESRLKRFGRNRKRLRADIQIDRLGGRRLFSALCLMSLAVTLCAGCIALLLRHIDAKNATFKPPMTALERERLMPPEPRLESAPSLSGIRYRDQVRKAAAESLDLTLDQPRLVEPVTASPAASILRTSDRSNR